MTNRTVEINPVGERIAEIIRHYNLNKNAFAKKIGLSDNSLISRIVNDHKRGISLELIQRIAIGFPDVNLKWFILGKGEMIEKSQPILAIQTVEKYLLVTRI